MHEAHNSKTPCLASTYDQSGACADAGATWLAYQTATGVLSAAKALLDTVGRGASWAALQAAQATLSDMQSAADAVLSGAEWTTRQTASDALDAAKAVVDGIMSGTEAVAYAAATATLDTAKAAADAVLTGTEWAAWNAAQGALDAANGALAAAQSAADGAVSALQAALDTVGSALAGIRASGFLQLNYLELRLKANTGAFSAGVAYDATILGTPYRGSVDIDITDPYTFVAKLLVGSAVSAVKAAYPALSGFMT